MIFFWAVAGRTIVVYNDIILLHAANDSWLIHALLQVYESFTVMLPATCVIVTIECRPLRQCVRIVIMHFAVLFLLLEFLRMRLTSTLFTDGSDCLWIVCIEYRERYLISVFTLMLFVTKLLLYTSVGHPFVVNR